MKTETLQALEWDHFLVVQTHGEAAPGVQPEAEVVQHGLDLAWRTRMGIDAMELPDRLELAIVDD
jgi:hypothetical protein